MTLSYGNSSVENERDLGVYRYHPHTGIYEPLPSSVDPDTNQVTADVDHFSTFVVLNRTAWEEIENRSVSTKNSGKDLATVEVGISGGNDAYGTVTVENDSIADVWHGNSIDSDGNGDPPRGSTSHSRCTDDELYRLNDTTIDFNLDTCGATDRFFVEYRLDGPNTTLELDLRATASGLKVGGNRYHSDARIPVDEVATNYSGADSDGDGILDHIEEQSIPLATGGTVKTDPTEADTDGDGLPDGAEVNLSAKTAAGYALDSDPTKADTDGDGLNDFRDPQRLTESVPPSINITFDKMGFIGPWRNYMAYVEADDESQIKRMVVNFSNANTEITRPNAKHHLMVTPGTQNAQTLTIEVEDEHGNKHRVAIEIHDNGSKSVSSNAVLAGAHVTASSRSASTKLVKGIKFSTLGIVIFSAEYAIRESNAGEWQEAYSAPLYATPEVESYRNSEYVLREGFAKTNNGFTRGYGQAYIEATTGLTTTEIGTVVRNGEVVDGPGEIEYIIGEVGEKKIILTIIGGTLMAASSGKIERNEDCEDWVQYENDETKDGNPDHTLGRDRSDGKDKFLETVEQIVEIINSPDRIVSGNGARYYLKKVNGKWVALLLEGGDVYWKLITALDNNGKAYDSLEDLMDSIDDREKNPDTVYDPENGIDNC